MHSLCFSLLSCSNAPPHSLPPTLSPIFKRVNYEDRGKRSTLDGISEPEDLRRIFTYDLRQTELKQMVIAMKQVLLYSLPHYMLLRGQQIRHLELCDMLTMKYANKRNPDNPHIALCFSTKEGKTNAKADRHYSGSMRHRNIEDCSHRVSAFYFFMRFHISGEDPPDFSARKNWYNIKAVLCYDAGTGKCSDREKRITYPDHLRAATMLLNATGQNSTKGKTHLCRGSGVLAAERLGITVEIIKQMGFWEQSALKMHYMAMLPREGLFKMAEFETYDSIYWARDVEVPEVLLKKVFPWIEEWLEEFEKRKRFEAQPRRKKSKKNNGEEEERLDEADIKVQKTDLAAVGFLRLLKYLRKVKDFTCFNSLFSLQLTY